MCLCVSIYQTLNQLSLYQVVNLTVAVGQQEKIIYN